MNRPRNLMLASDWNEMYPVGTLVRFWSVRGAPEHVDAKTRSEAWLANSGDVLVMLEGKAGGINVEHCRPLLPVGPECRRCSECEGAEHHWLDTMAFECKHCGALAPACSSCVETAAAPGDPDEYCASCRAGESPGFDLVDAEGG